MRSTLAGAQTGYRHSPSPLLAGRSPSGPHFFIRSPGAQTGYGTIERMASESFDFDEVTRVTTGALGEPGKRAFYLQVRTAAELVSLAIEKDQLRALTERLQEVALEEPIAPIWRVGFMTLTYSQDEKAFEVSLVELVDEGDQPATGHFQASLAQMQALAAHAAVLISAGRPPCPMCGGPIDHDGGVCPRLNGHH